jgi:hypothetical protein
MTFRYEKPVYSTHATNDGGGKMRTNMKNLIVVSLLLSMTLLAAGPAYAAPLYFPHIAAIIPWQTEIALINTVDQRVTGTLRAFSDDGQPRGTKAVTFFAHHRRQIDVATEFANHADIGYIIFDTNSVAIEGYVKFYKLGVYRAAVPAVKDVNTSNIHIPHICSNAQWRTRLSLLNTTSETKELNLVFNDRQSRNIILNANEHKVFDISSLFDNQPQPDIQSGVIINAGGIIGLELFGSTDDKQLDGILLTDKIASKLYYPHVESDSWWTGIAAYNPSNFSCTMTITPYDIQGTALTTSSVPIAGKGKYVGAVSGLGFPDDTAWFRIDSTRPLTGFELFSPIDNQQLAAYAGGGGAGTRDGVLPKIEKDGWTDIAFINTDAIPAYVSLTAYDDYGNAVDARAFIVRGHAKVVMSAENLFLHDISDATYIVYSSDRNIVGFQLNGSMDGTMLDGLPGIALSGSCAIDYLTSSSAVGGTLPVTTIGQSWIAPCTGYLSSISVQDGAQGTKGLYRLEIYKGESIFNTDKIAECNNISISGGMNQIDIPFVLKVISGLQYTFLFTCDAGDCYDHGGGYGLWLKFSATPYPDGNLIRGGWDNNRDLCFKIVISANP